MAIALIYKIVISIKPYKLGLNRCISNIMPVYERRVILNKKTLMQGIKSAATTLGILNADEMRITTGVFNFMQVYCMGLTFE